MEKFIEVLKRRIIFLSISSVIALLLTVITWYWGYGLIGSASHISDFMHGAQAGLLAGFFAIMFWIIIKYRGAIKDESKIKAIYIKENDEREKLIKGKIGGAGFDFIIGVMMIAIVISGFFNETVFLTLAGTLIFMVIVKISLKAVYNRKY